MKKTVLHLGISSLVLLSAVACKKDATADAPKTEMKKQLPTEKTITVEEPVQITQVEHYMTKEQQDKHTPDYVLSEFEAGNERFKNNKMTVRDHSAAVKKAVEGQFPKAFVLSCIDSRVPVEDIFDQGIGDIFVGRVAGNFENTDMLGSMEYACKVSGAKLIVVLGHESCGAVKGAIDHAKDKEKLGNITPMLENIKPAIAMSTYAGKEKKDSHNKEYLHEVSINNIKNTIKDIREKSPILKEMEEKGQIKIVGALYSLSNGHMEYVK